MYNINFMLLKIAHSHFYWKGQDLNDQKLNYFRPSTVHLSCYILLRQQRDFAILKDVNAKSISLIAKTKHFISQVLCLSSVVP